MKVKMKIYSLRAFSQKSCCVTIEKTRDLNSGPKWRRLRASAKVLTEPSTGRASKLMLLRAKNSQSSWRQFSIKRSFHRWLLKEHNHAFAHTQEFDFRTLRWLRFKSVCIVLNQVWLCPKTSQNQRSVIHGSRKVSICV